MASTAHCPNNIEGKQALTSVNRFKKDRSYHGGEKMARNWLTAVTYGIAASFVIVLASAFLLASLLRFTSYSETGGSVLPIVISVIALFTGGIISGSKMKERGLLIGSITGLFYCLFSLFFQFLGLDQAPGPMQYVFYMANIASCSIGGAIGVNFFAGKHL